MIAAPSSAPRSAPAITPTTSATVVLARNRRSARRRSVLPPRCAAGSPTSASLSPSTPCDSSVSMACRTSTKVSYLASSAGRASWALAGGVGSSRGAVLIANLPGRLHSCVPGKRLAHSPPWSTSASVRVQQRRHLLRGEADAPRGDVLLEVRDRSGPGDRQHRGRARQQPRQHHLRRGDPVARRHLVDLPVGFVVLDRRPGQERDVLLLAEVDHRLGLAVAEVVAV